MTRRPKLLLLGLLLSAPAALAAQPTSANSAVPACATSADWNTPHAPQRIFGNTYYVGTACLGAILITSDSGHVLIDGALPASAPLIAANIQALGFRLSSIRWLLNSHAHYDHAGGLAERVVDVVRRRALPGDRVRRQSDADFGGRVPVLQQHDLPERRAGLRRRASGVGASPV